MDNNLEKINKYIGFVKNETEKYNVELELHVNSHVDYPGGEFKVNGYFDGVKPKLAVGTGKDIKEWFPILIHEMNHLKQWVNKTQAWENSSIYKIDCYEFLDKWISGKEYSDSNIKNAILKCIDIELECEKNTLSDIINYNLQGIIDPIEYIQKSNSYLYFYGVIYKTRKWYTPGNEPYNTKEIWSRMPKTFGKDKYNYFHTPDEIYNLYSIK
jgi:hypothetical protein